MIGRVAKHVLGVGRIKESRSVLLKFMKVLYVVPQICSDLLDDDSYW